jgi:hypothetical protein
MKHGRVWPNFNRAVRVALGHIGYELTGRLTQLHNEGPFRSRYPSQILNLFIWCKSIRWMDRVACMVKSREDSAFYMD